MGGSLTGQCRGPCQGGTQQGSVVFVDVSHSAVHVAQPGDSPRLADFPDLENGGSCAGGLCSAGPAVWCSRAELHQDSQPLDEDPEDEVSYTAVEVPADVLAALQRTDAEGPRSPQARPSESQSASDEQRPGIMRLGSASSRAGSVFSDVVTSTGRFQVLLDSSTGAQIGLVLTKALGCLVIQHVSELPSALALQWNQAHPEKVIKSGDKIVAINRKRGSGEELLAEIRRTRGKLELSVQRDADLASIHTVSSGLSQQREIPLVLEGIGVGQLRRPESVLAPSGSVEDSYELGELLGEGGFGKVWKATHRSTSETLAVKSTPLNKLKTAMKYEQEFRILRRMKHANIVRLEEVFQDATHMHFVMEYCAGGSLGHRIRHVEHSVKRMQGRGGLSSALMEACLAQMLCGIAYLHHHRFVHRDIKPDNYLFEKPGNDYGSLKLADFGLATRCQDGKTLSGMVGTIYYVAPDMIMGNYTSKVDLWSIGITAFETALGTLPYMVLDQAKLADVIVHGQLAWNEHAWKSVNVQFKALVSILLTKDPIRRPSATDLFDTNAWLQKQVKLVQGTSSSTAAGGAAPTASTAPASTPRWGLRSLTLSAMKRER
mmetsp:Transcript_41984/g.96405  ORF Transcript_41984/g.96405 Transcript_41984/m.96405 type:complete len:603 (-) Transcript_41984:75-1883(-)